MTSSSARKRLGNWGEKVAVEYLREHGFLVRETNFRCPQGEMDIIAEKGDYLVFVEVRTRRGSQFGLPEESVTPAKRERLISIAEAYWQAHENLPPLWRIDVIAIDMGPGGRPSRIELIENAVTGSP